MPHTLPWIDTENSKVVYVVMYYRESFKTPPPMAEEGCNVALSRTSAPNPQIFTESSADLAL